MSIGVDIERAIVQPIDKNWTTPPNADRLRQGQLVTEQGIRIVTENDAEVLTE